ncbi:MAG: putative Ig domain-containing protein, partial [Candidatus Poseidoniaceae archaeon]|nr:putative Ig domain-containing protein [Candidatus Poseidoniaceae archaeon]
SASTIVTVEVNEADPVIAYGTTTLTTQINLQINPITATSTGGPVETWSILPALPTGLDIDESTGEISGTPTVVSPSTVYTITASNSGGTDTATVTIQVNDVAPSSVTYSSTFLQLTKDSAMTPETATNLGGTVTSWTIYPSLPSGLSINAANGTISGTPQSVSTATTYTVTAANSGGSVTVSITILIYDAPPSSINYSPSSSSLTLGTPMGSVIPTYSGGTANSWTITPTQPAGLTFDISSGEIGGTPTAVSPLTTYTITATNAGGSGSTTITIQVNDIPPYQLSYNDDPFTLTKGTVMSDANPTVSGGTVDTWIIDPALPTGLVIDPSTGVISGNPTVISSTTSYIITASNTGGVTTTTVSITVNDVVPSSITYSHDPYTLTRDSAMIADTPTVLGGAVDSWVINPSLPTGLSIDPTTGEISGTPNSVSPLTTYTVTATNTGGSATTTIDILVNDAPPSGITYGNGPFSYENGTPITPLSPSAGGGAVVSWTVVPALPTGLVLDPSTGVISGTPTVNSPSTVYNVTATNAGGSNSTTFTLEVNDVPPSLIVYNPNSFSLSKDSPMSSVTPTNDGGDVETWTVSPALPQGLVIDGSTGEIYGTPTAITAYGTYTITGTNTG